MQAGDDAAYTNVMVGMISDLEKSMKEMIGAVLKSLNLDMQAFGMAMMMSQQDPQKGKQMMEIKQQVLDIPEEEILDEGSCLKVFAQQHAM